MNLITNLLPLWIILFLDDDIILELLLPNIELLTTFFLVDFQVWLFSATFFFFFFSTRITWILNLWVFRIYHEIIWGLTTDWNEIWIWYMSKCLNLVRCRCRMTWRWLGLSSSEWRCLINRLNLILLLSTLSLVIRLFKWKIRLVVINAN